MTICYIDLTTHLQVTATALNAKCPRGLSAHFLDPPASLWFQRPSVCRSPDPTSGLQATYPIAHWTAPLAHFKSNLKITSKNVFYDDDPRALINSTNPLSKPETWASFPIPPLSQPINHRVLLIITSRLLFSPSTRLPLPPDGATAKSPQHCSPPSHVHPEARVIFQKCKPHHVVACLGGMPATWGWGPALALGGSSSLGYCHVSPCSRWRLWGLTHRRITWTTVTEYQRPGLASGQLNPNPISDCPGRPEGSLRQL